jgi:hydrogenase-4 component F
LLAITGSPPFGAFVSELAILKGMIDAGRYMVAVLYLTALAIVFVGMSAVVLPIVYGKPIKLPAKGKDEISYEKQSEIAANEIPPAKIVEPLWSILPPLVFAAAALALGLYLPQPLLDLLHSAATAVGAE